MFLHSRWNLFGIYLLLSFYLALGCSYMSISCGIMSIYCWPRLCWLWLLRQQLQHWLLRPLVITSKHHFLWAHWSMVLKFNITRYYIDWRVQYGRLECCLHKLESSPLFSWAVPQIFTWLRWLYQSVEFLIDSFPHLLSYSRCWANIDLSFSITYILCYWMTFFGWMQGKMYLLLLGTTALSLVNLIFNKNGVGHLTTEYLILV